MMAKIGIFNTGKDIDPEFFKEHLKGHDLTFFSENIQDITPAALKDFEAIAIFVSSHVTKKQLDAMPKLKGIACMSTGFDNVDLHECQARKIKVSNVPTYGENTVAEHAFALLLGIAKHVPEAVNRTRCLNFSLENLRSFDLSGKTIGIIGLGNIGKHMARMAYGFEMNIIGFDTKPSSELKKKFGVKYKKTVEDIYKEADVLSFHVPLNKYTHHLLKMKHLKMLKKGVVIINTSRGEVIETELIYEGIQQKIITAAGLDVIEKETIMEDDLHRLRKDFLTKTDMITLLQEHILRDLPNVLLTPHSAFHSTEALERIMGTSIENLVSFFKGRQKNKIV